MDLAWGCANRPARRAAPAPLPAADCCTFWSTARGGIARGQAVYFPLNIADRVSVLDGRKVLAWNVGVFAVLIIAAFGTLLLSYYPQML